MSVMMYTTEAGQLRSSAEQIVRELERSTVLLVRALERREASILEHLEARGQALVLLPEIPREQWTPALLARLTAVHRQGSLAAIRLLEEKQRTAGELSRLASRAAHARLSAAGLSYQAILDLTA
jgi:hypothetical protein